MKKIIIPIIVIILIAVGFAVYYFLPKETSLDTEDKVKIQTMEAINGQNFLITLLGKKSSGYEWNANYDSNAVEFVTREYIEPEGDLLEGAGFEKFTFKALKEGETDIEFVFKKVEDTDDKAIDRIYYQVTIKPNI